MSKGEQYSSLAKEFECSYQQSLLVLPPPKKKTKPKQNHKPKKLQKNPQKYPNPNKKTQTKSKNPSQQSALTASLQEFHLTELSLLVLENHP